MSLRVEFTLPTNTGSNGQALVTNGSGVLSFSSAAGAYDGFSVITSNTSLAARGQYISNSSSTLTHTLPSGSAGDTIIISNAGKFAYSPFSPYPVTEHWIILLFISLNTS